MSKDIRIKKGLTIKLKGKAEEIISAAPRSRVFCNTTKIFSRNYPKADC